MTETNITHVSVRALDLEESINFYADIFGAENVERIPTPNFGDPLVQWLRIGNLELHLFELDIPAAPRYYHFGVGAGSVERFHEIYLKVKERGIFDSVTFGHHIYELPGGCVQLYIVDPTGNLVEVDWPDATDLDPSIVTDIKRFVDLRPQSEQNMRSSIFLSKLFPERPSCDRP